MQTNHRNELYRESPSCKLPLRRNDENKITLNLNYGNDPCTHKNTSVIGVKTLENRRLSLEFSRDQYLQRVHALPRTPRRTKRKLRHYHLLLNKSFDNCYDTFLIFPIIWNRYNF